METKNTEITVKKPVLDEDEKVLIGQKLGAILRKYPTNARIRDAEIPVTAIVFEPISKTSTKGYLIEVTGNIEKIDFAQNRVTIDGRGYKLSLISKLTVPAEFDAEDEFFSDGFSDEYAEDFPSWETEPKYEKKKPQSKLPTKTILFQPKGGLHNAALR